jgi:hypothetical protein
MNHVSKISCAMIVTAISAGADAANDPSAGIHHPAQAVSTSAKKALPARPDPVGARMDAQMRSMDMMHVKMMAARTPQERAPLMAEHRKIMHDGMAMMGDRAAGGRKGDTAARHQTMEMRMDMMRAITHMMMMDRQAAEPAK